ncbi:proteasome subunit beta type 2 [Aphelenchoides avenae]|nr:proteasome subunit beta type 2 [Aphelenchus avenae]
MNNHLLVALRTPDFVILGADKLNTFDGITCGSVTTVPIGEQTYITVVGQPSDVNNFANWVLSGLASKARTLPPRAAFHWVQENAARNPWQVDTIVSGYSNSEQKPFLGFVDRFGSGIEAQDFICRGIADNDAMMAMRSGFRQGMTEGEAVALVEKCLRMHEQMIGMPIRPCENMLVITSEGIRRPDQKPQLGGF